MSTSDMNVNPPSGRPAFLPPEEELFVPPIGQVETAKTTEVSYAQYVSAYIPQSFNKGYVDDSKANEPRLPSPIEGQKKQGAEPAIQDIVRGFIAKEITLLLPQINSPVGADTVFANLMQGAKIEDPALQTIADQIRSQIETKVKKEARLENFTLEALYTPNESAWIQAPLAPYGREKKAEIYESHGQTLQKNLSSYLEKNLPQDPTLLEAYAGMKERLTIAVQGGNVHPSIKTALEEIKNQSVQETQQKFGLPISWKPGTTEVDNWKPINLGIVSATAVGFARTERFGQNVGALLTNLNKVSGNLIKNIPENDPRREVVQGFISAIIDATSEFKKSLEEFQIMLGQQTEQNLQFIKENQQVRDQVALAKIDETKASQKKQIRMEKFGFAMKIIGPIIAALSVVVGALVSALTVGLASPIAIAGIAVGLGMLTYSVVDSATGVTSKLMGAFNDFIDSISGSAPDWAKPLIKLAVVVTAVVIVALLVAAVATGSGAGAVANAATQTLATAAKQATVMAIKQLAIQASLIFVMGSGVLVEVPAELLKLTGLDNTSIDILKYTIMAIEMVAIFVVSAKLSSSAMKIPGQNTAVAVQQTSQSISQKLGSAARVIKQEVTETTEAIVKAFKDSLDAVINRVRNIQTILPDIKAAFIESLEALKHVFASRTKGEIGLLVAGKAVQTGPLILNLTSSAYIGVVHIQLANILKDAGDTEEMMAEIQALMDLLDNVVRQLESAMSANAEDILAFSETVDNLFRSLTASTKKLVESAPVQG